jgi:FlaA1/EpsC-like NDP-sugar epimerase
LVINDMQNLIPGKSAFSHQAVNNSESHTRRPLTMSPNNTSNETPATDKVVLVAGGTGGLGRAVSLAFLREAAHVIVTYQHPQEFDELKDLAAGNGSRLEGFSVDVTDEPAVSRLVRILCSATAASTPW